MPGLSNNLQRCFFVSISTENSNAITILKGTWEKDKEGVKAMRRNDENTLYFDSTTDSEPVHFNGVLGDTLLREEVGYLETLITLQLNDFARLLIIDEGTVASKFLLLKRDQKICPGAGVFRPTFLNALSNFLESYSIQ